MIKLWLDDIRCPPDSTWNVVTNSSEAINFIKINGLPNHISFDHDLGENDTAIIVVNFIIESYLDNNLIIPKNFTFNIHSANPVGALNIKSKMNQFINYVFNK